MDEKIKNTGSMIGVGTAIGEQVLQLVQCLHTKYQKDLDLKKLTFIICNSIRH